MFRRCKSRRRSRAAAAEKLRREELERTTDIFFSDMNDVNPAQGDEACMTEGDNFVATTAIFDEEWQIVPLCQEMWPKKQNRIPRGC